MVHFKGMSKSLIEAVVFVTMIKPGVAKNIVLDLVYLKQVFVNHLI